MNIKSFKNKFNIKHIVSIKDGKLLIGSPYIPDIVKIDLPTGIIEKEGSSVSFIRDNYPELLNSSPESILKLIEEKESPEDLVDVYTFSDSNIIKKKAEEFGYPNVTTDGELMYDNTFFRSYGEALNQAIKEAEAGIKFLSRSVEDQERDLDKKKDELNKLKECLKLLKESSSRKYRD
tara:strand:+ start:10256 stop:10789 length:534 start_codon:yes stop_codon:yes gene_type:complete